MKNQNVEKELFVVVAGGMVMAGGSSVEEACKNFWDAVDADYDIDVLETKYDIKRHLSMTTHLFVCNEKLFNFDE